MDEDKPLYSPTTKRKMTLTYTRATFNLDEFNIYHNMHTDDFSCATRLLELLGVRGFERERYADIDKVGIWHRYLLDLLTLCWNVGIHHSLKFRSIQTDGDPVACTQYMLEDIQTRYLKCTNNTRQLKLPDIYIYSFSDHIAFCVKTSYLITAHKAILQATTDPLNIADVVESIPPTRGRAGAKVFVNAGTLRSIGKGSVLQQLLLRKINDSAKRNAWEQVFVIAILFLEYLSIGAHDVSWWLYNHKTIWSASVPESIKILKAAHVSTRMAHKLPGLSVHYARSVKARAWATSLYGLDTLSGRSEDMSIDFPAEQLMRAVDSTKRAWVSCHTNNLGYKYLRFSREQYAERIAQIARGTVETLLQKETKLETFTEFFSNRMFWGASGGSPGGKVTWDTTNEKLRVNKRGSLLSIKEEKIRRILEYMVTNKNPKPVQWSVKAIKYESGKLRSILNTVLENYIIQGYIYNMVDANTRDDSWYSSAHSNASRIANTIRRLKDLKRRCGLMWDYADFNLNHTYYLMANQYITRVDVLLARAAKDMSQEKIDRATKDLRAATAYTVLARYATYLHDPDNHSTMQSSRGLQSGERGTSSTNSDANKTDTSVVRETARELLGYDPLNAVADHAGDDAFETIDCLSDAPLVCSLYNLTGAAGQAHKIACSYNSFGGAAGEFLRLAYDAAASTVRGYPIRGMMGFIHGEFFAEAVPQPYDRLASFLNQRLKLSRRGWIAPTQLFTAVVRYNTRLTYTLANGDKRHFYPDPKLAVMPAALGGFGIDTADASIVQMGEDTTFIKPIDSTVVDAVIIPSGEGKSTLARNSAGTYVDHDSLCSFVVLNKLRTNALLSGNWGPVNSYLVGVAQEYFSNNTQDTKILLTWSPDTCPPNLRVVACLLNRPTGIRANKANRRAITSSMANKYITTFQNYGERDAWLNALVSSREAAAYDVSLFTAADKPKFQWPVIDSLNMLKRTKVQLRDHSTLHRHGLKMDVSIADAITQSALSGAWPKELLYQSIANYARELAIWSRSGTWSNITVYPKPIISNEKFQALARQHILSSLGAYSVEPLTNNGSLELQRNELGFPKTRQPRHHYNYIPTLTKVLGCSVNATAQYIIKKNAGATFIDKLVNCLEAEKRYKRSVGEYNRQIDDILEFLSTPKTFIEAGMKSNITVVSSNFEKWFTGGMSFIPPSNSQQSADLSTFVRDTLLSLIEAHLLDKVLSIDNDIQLVITVYHLEQWVQNSLQKVLDQLIPGVSIKD
nr:RNA-dependent RNA polymerase [Trichoderma polysporum fusagravirus]